MTLSQFVIARTARQMADQIAAGEIMTRKERRYAVSLFDALGRYAHALPLEEFNTAAPAFAPIWAVVDKVEAWRSQFASEE